jgi:hypothetical protein
MADICPDPDGRGTAMTVWNELSTDEKLEQLKKSQLQWNNLMAPRLTELRELLAEQASEMSRLMRRIEALEDPRV